MHPTYSKPTRTHAAVAALALVLAAAAAQAAVTAEEAKALTGRLTPMGAERAGNASGTIPAWDGGLTTVPPDYKPGHRQFDPFAADKPVLKITAENMAQHSDKLSEGVRAMLQKYPKTFRLDVYPTRRSAAAPQWVYDNTARNAVSAKLENDGMTVVGAHGGVPFPIPKSALEVRMNHLTRWRGETSLSRMKTWSMTANGRKVLASENTDEAQHPYYYRDSSAAQNSESILNYAILVTTAPAFRAGEALMVHETFDFAKGRSIWQYLAGQRRVRQAPNIAFDTPNAVASGVNFVDETFGGVGSPERFDWKLLGKKEMYIPYNTNRLQTVPDEQAIAEHHLAPEQLRWELHRVWVVEATLKADKRHAVPKRVYYYDEDTWGTALYDGWDAQGKLWRTQFMLPFAAPDIPAQVNNATNVLFNLQTGSWVYDYAMGDGGGDQYRPFARKPASYFSPEALAGRLAR
ncbi:MAG: DUF1329 domain-containing protein [Gammaproteobacteria bacterium]|nr:DUF1329 domain-containing protein [Gammaproteobacteria bacterium]